MGSTSTDILDDSGYTVTAADLAFLSIHEAAIVAWRGGMRPLGLSDVTYKALTSRLWEALASDGLSVDDVDIRLKGSSSTFFSGFHKTMPTTREELVVLFRALRGRFPEVFELIEIDRRLDGQWPIVSRPLRRPFDALHKLGIDRVPSDCDLQLSSDAIVLKCEREAADRGIAPIREVTHHNVYDFIRKDLLRVSMPHVSAFASLMSEALQRDVSVAVFPSSGPPDRSDEIGGLSSHLRDSDWRIFPPQGGETELHPRE